MGTGSYTKLHDSVYISLQSRVRTGKNSNAVPRAEHGKERESSWLLLFGGWVKLATLSLLPKQWDNFNRQSGILLKCI